MSKKKDAKKKVSLQQEYLKKHRAQIYSGNKSTPTYAQWASQQGAKGSKQTKSAMGSLSKSDYDEIQKRFGKK